MAIETAPIDLDPALFGATVRVPVAPMHAEPQVASPMLSQQLAGHRVEVVDEEGEWALARGVDRYHAWVHQGFLLRHRADGPAGRDAPRPRRMSLGCVATRRGAGDRGLPLRAYLEPDEVVQTGEVIDETDIERRFPPEPSAITATARLYFRGASYLWGGVTPWGADCSGFVQSAFALHGIQLPRDAWQQSETGDDAGDDIAALREADLLFFSDRADQRVTHVGLSLGGYGMVHLALGRGGYAIEQLDDRHDPYVAKLRARFVFAKRVIA
jgi:gamma-D-glutamyl-L-lysine dipeptidyl-peptidase